MHFSFVVLLLAVAFTANGQQGFDFGQIAQLTQQFQGGAQADQGAQGGQGGFDFSQIAQQFTQGGDQGGAQGSQGGLADISQFTQGLQGVDVNQFVQMGGAFANLAQQQQGQDQGQEQGQEQGQGQDAAAQLAAAQQVLGTVQQTGFGERFGDVLNAANGILGLFGRAMAEDPVTLEDLNAVDAAAAMAEQELDFAMADFAVAADNGNSNSAPATPAWAIGLIVLGVLVLVALVIVQVQLVALYRSRGSRTADRV